MQGAHYRPAILRARWSVIARWALGLAILVALVRFLPLAPLRHAVSRVSAERFAALLAGYLLAHALGVAKWRMVVNAAGAGLDVRTSARCYGGGLFGTLFLPSIVGGDVVRLAVGLRRSAKPAAVIAGNVVDRCLDVTAQVGLVIAGLAMLPEALPEDVKARGEKALIIGMGAAVAVVAVLLLLRKRILRGRSVRFRRRLARLRHAFGEVSSRPQALILGWLAGTGIQLTFLLLTARLAMYCGLILPVRAWLFAWPLAKLAAVLPITQGGMGVREAALVALLKPFGGAPTLVLATGLIWEGIIIAGGLLAGAIALGLGRFDVER